MVARCKEPLRNTSVIHQLQDATGLRPVVLHKRALKYGLDNHLFTKKDVDNAQAKCLKRKREKKEDPKNQIRNPRYKMYA